jgi:3-oxoacyl-[acyl-carrier protein] reductase
VAAAVKALGPLDIFVSSAGLLLGGSITALKVEDLDRLWAVNVRAAAIGIQSAAQAMRDGGRIVTIGSVGAVRTGVAGASIYGMTKAALVGLVRGAAIDLAPRAITVNNVQPGPTATDMNPADGPVAEWLLQRIPLGRFGTDAEVASLVAYLATRDAAFITGASLTVDGGYIA